MRLLAESGATGDVVVAPIGFVCENMEIVYDLDVQARQLGEGLGLNLVRTALLGSHRRFAEMIRELVVERMEANPTRPALGTHGPAPDSLYAGVNRTPPKGTVPFSSDHASHGA